MYLAVSNLCRIIFTVPTILMNERTLLDKMRDINEYILKQIDTLFVQRLIVFG